MNLYWSLDILCDMQSERAREGKPLTTIFRAADHSESMNRFVRDLGWREGQFLKEQSCS